MKVLIVDDEPMILRAVGRQLRGLGFVVATANTIKEAEAVFENGVPDVVLTDWEPLGVAMCNIALDFHVPVVVFTGNVELAQATRLPTVTRILEKPVKIQELVAALREATGSKP